MTWGESARSRLARTEAKRYVQGMGVGSQVDKARNKLRSVGSTPTRRPFLERARDWYHLAQIAVVLYVNSRRR